MDKRGAAAIGVASAIAMASVAALMSTPACATHACDFNQVTYGTFGDPLLLGHFIGDTWESTPIDEDWFYFKSERQFTFFMPPSFRFTRRPISILAYLSEEAHPVNADYTSNPSLIALASGNAAEITYDEAHAALSVHNGTCQDYFVRIVVTFAPIPDAEAPDGGAPEAGLDGAPDAVQDGASDAGAEANADANAD